MIGLTALALVPLLATASPELRQAVRYEYEVVGVDATGVAPPGSRGIAYGVLVAPTKEGLLVVLEGGGAPRLAFRTTSSRLARDFHLAFRSDEEPMYSVVIDGKVQRPEYPSWPEFDPVADALAGPARVVEAIRNGFPERWKGEPWAAGSTWMGWMGALEVGEHCDVAGIRGVTARFRGYMPRVSEHVACIDPDLPLPLSSTGSAGCSEPNRLKPARRWSARLVRREPLEVRSQEDAVGLWRRTGSRGLVLRADGTGSEVEGSLPAQTLASVPPGPLRALRALAWAWDGARVLELGHARTRAGVKVLAVDRALRLEGANEALHLTTGSSGVPGAEGLALVAAGRVKTAPIRAGAPASGSAGKKPDLVDAAERCDRELTDTLLAAGASPRRARVHPPSPHGLPRRSPELPLHAAALCGDPAIVRALLDRGADPNAKVRDRPALSYALTGGAPEIVALLLSRGARRDATDADGSLLGRTVEMNRRDLYEAFLSAGAPPGYLEMHRALESRDPAALRSALAGGGRRWAADAQRLCGLGCPVELAKVIAVAAR